MSAPSSDLSDAPERDAALDLDGHALVTAPAGSGKTGLLVQRLLAALAVVEEPEQVVAITFTNKAAAEIRARVLQALSAAVAAPVADDDVLDTHDRAVRQRARAVLARDVVRGWQLLQQPARLSATTIDAFCMQTAAQLPLLSGLGGTLAISEDARGLYREALLRLFEEIEDASVPEADRAAMARVLRLSGNRLDRLIEPLSELLGRREQWLGAAATVPADAAEDFWREQDRLALERLILPALQAFESALPAADREALVELLREGAGQHDLLAWAAELHDWPSAQAANLDTLRRLASCLLTSNGELRKSGGVNVKTGFLARQPYTLRFKALLDGWAGDAELQALAAAVRELPDACLHPELVALRGAWLRVLRRLAGHLKLVFADHQQADFPELAMCALQALRATDTNVGDALLATDARIRHLLVDEMQDTSEAQLDLLRHLTASWTPGDGRSLFLVGDPQQSIYAFRKAEVRLFLDLWNTRRLGALDLVPLRLSANFRSDPRMVADFNTAFGQIFPTRLDVLRGAVPFTASTSQREPMADAAGLDVQVFDDREAEADAVAARAITFANGGRSVVVLARARNHLEPVIRALRERGHLPACQDIDPLAAVPEVRDVLALALALWHPQDRLHWAVLLRAPFVGLSWADLVNLSRGRVREPWPARIVQALADPQGLSDEGRVRLQRLHDALEASGRSRSQRAALADRTEAVWRRLHGPLCCTRAGLDDVRQALLCLREEARGGGVRDLARLRRRLTELYAAPRAGQVQLMTVHKSKGLEFDHVLLVGCNRKPRNEDQPWLHLFDVEGPRLLLPRPDEAWPEDHPAHRSYQAVQALHVAGRRSEALRLLYVAITRARRTATVTVAVERDRQTGALQPYAAQSFAQALLPVIDPVVQAHVAATPALPAAQPPPAPMAQTAAVVVANPPPRAWRLRLDARPPAEAPRYRPPELRTLRPSEALLGDQAEPSAARVDEIEDVYAQLVGTLYHEAMQRIAAEGLAAWSDGGARHRGSMAAGLRRRGMPEPMVDLAVARVIELLNKTLDSEDGRWLLSPKPWARSEYPLAGRSDGRWISAVIDRCFEDDDGTLWVVDYKTSARPVAAERLARYLEEGGTRYREQVARYADLLAQLKPGRQMRAALYFAEAGQLASVVTSAVDQ
ncbi:UvrD-helicase domain-containing protein [Panacagrimonas sp.]|uniref:UvrD-helicase domain-containing protein n=1 Tax=Panacagrimonas sp. TaxID=2480088 RepID=UPI003B51BDBE